MGPCKIMTDTLAPVERTNWALPAWDFTLAQNDVPSALSWSGPSVGNWSVSSPGGLLYGQDHLWATGHLVSSPGGFCRLPPHLPSPPTRPSLSSHPPPPCNTGLKLMHIFEKIV